jgi:hypothetical protein
VDVNADLKAADRQSIQVRTDALWLTEPFP